MASTHTQLIISTVAGLLSLMADSPSDSSSVWNRGFFPRGIISPPDESHPTVLLQTLRSSTCGVQAMNHRLQLPTEVKLRSGEGRNSVIKEASSAQSRCGPDNPELALPLRLSIIQIAKVLSCCSVAQSITVCLYTS